MTDKRIYRATSPPVEYGTFDAMVLLREFLLSALALVSLRRSVAAAFSMLMPMSWRYEKGIDVFADPAGRKISSAAPATRLTAEIHVGGPVRIDGEILKSLATGSEKKNSEPSPGCELTHKRPL